MCSRTIDDRLIYVSTGSAVVNAKRARIFALPSRSFSSSPPIIFRESRFLACSFDESRDPSLLSRARVSAQVFRRKKNLRMKVYIYIYTSAPSLAEGGKRVRVNRLFAYGVYTNFMRVKEVLSSLFLTANSFAHAYIFVISSLEQRRSSKFIFIELIRFKLSLYYFIF